MESRLSCFSLRIDRPPARSSERNAVKLLILGGTRFVGSHVAETLVEAGADVTLFHRGETGGAIHGTTSVIGDRSHSGSLAQLDSARFDAVLDMSGYFSQWTRDALEAFRGRVGHYVFISSGAVYRPSEELPWPETTPLGPFPIWGQYGQEKVESERLLWQAHAAGDIVVTVFRLPFILGPGNFTDRESFAFSRLLAGSPILLPGGGTALNQFVYARDVVRALVAALENPGRGGGQAYNCAHPSAVTNRGWIDLCADVAGVEPRIVGIDEQELGVASETVDLANLVFPFPAHHYVLDGSKLQRDLDIEMPTGNRRMLEEYWEWWNVAADRSPKRYQREDAALAALGIG